MAFSFWPTLLRNIIGALHGAHDPIEWENVVLYGEYVLNRELVRRLRNP